MNRFGYVTGLPGHKLALWVVLLVVAVITIVTSGGEAPRRLGVTLFADGPGALQVFYDTGSGLSEGNSARASFVAGENKITLPLPAVRLRALRIDPDASVAHMQLNSVVIEKEGSVQTLPLAGMRAVQEIKAIEPGPSGLHISMMPGATDPQLGLTIQQDPSSYSIVSARISLASRWLLVVIVGLWAVAALARSGGGRLPVPPLLLVAWVLTLAMAFATTTTRSIHPDEFSHATAAKYYLDHWLPPAVLDPAIAGTYSTHGTSYLNELDVVYFLAAKFSIIFTGLGVDGLIALRLFNVALFGLLVALTWRCRGAAAGFIVLLLTPQLWYVFSYLNADAFALFLSLIAFLLVAPPDSPVARFVEGEKVAWLPLIGFVLALGLLLISKRNFLPVVFTLGLGILCRHFGLRAWSIALAVGGAAIVLFHAVAAGNLEHMFPRTAQWFLPVGGALLGAFAIGLLWRVSREASLRPKAGRLALLMACALVVALPRIALDVAVNGTPGQKAISMSIAAERYGQPRFKPSTLETNISASSPGVSLARKGVSLGEVLGAPRQWVRKSWRSMLGVYGYLNVIAPSILYWVLALGVITVFGGAAVWALTHPPARSEFAVLVLGTALVVLSSATHSWANEFQAQGRYLFPALAMIGAYAFSQPDVVRTRSFRYGAAICFLGGFVSFVATAMPVLAGR